MNTPTLMADAKRRARQIRTARTEAMRRALARRVCFDLIAALRLERATRPVKESA
jgi:hypothetical protein